VLLPDEPAGKIITLTAGVVEIRASLHWRPGQEPRGQILRSLPNNESVRCSFLEARDEDASSISVTGEVRAFAEVDLRRTVELVLRAISVASILSEAVLEVCAVRLASPAVTSPVALGTLAQDLHDAGFPVAFGRSWSAAPNAEISIGTGADTDLTEFLDGHSPWQVLV